ncbi:CotO family spore coat protein [Bacillus haimaensis]|uniref:CotO family spore coat protein n=1 Tax=Bacillus haimaensis TaxID=3160967 RepID=UPI003AA9C6DA
MKKQTDKIKHEPLLYIHTTTNSNVEVAMQSSLLIEVKKRKAENAERGLEEGKAMSSIKSGKKVGEEKKKLKKPFHNLSLEEKIHYLIVPPMDSQKKMCKIITTEQEYIGKVVGYHNEILAVNTPNIPESIFLTLQEIKEIHVIGI